MCVMLEIIRIVLSMSDNDLQISKEYLNKSRDCIENSQLPKPNQPISKKILKLNEYLKQEMINEKQIETHKQRLIQPPPQTINIIPTSIVTPHIIPSIQTTQHTQQIAHQTVQQSNAPIIISTQPQTQTQTQIQTSIVPPHTSQAPPQLPSLPSQTQQQQQQQSHTNILQALQQHQHQQHQQQQQQHTQHIQQQQHTQHQPIGGILSSPGLPGMIDNNNNNSINNNNNIGIGINNNINNNNNNNINNNMTGIHEIITQQKTQTIILPQTETSMTYPFENSDNNDSYHRPRQQQWHQNEQTQMHGHTHIDTTHTQTQTQSQSQSRSHFQNENQTYYDNHEITQNNNNYINNNNNDNTAENIGNYDWQINMFESENAQTNNNNDTINNNNNRHYTQHTQNHYIQQHSDNTTIFHTNDSIINDVTMSQEGVVGGFVRANERVGVGVGAGVVVKDGSVGVGVGGSNVNNMQFEDNLRIVTGNNDGRYDNNNNNNDYFRENYYDNANYAMHRNDTNINANANTNTNTNANVLYELGTQQQVVQFDYNANNSQRNNNYQNWGDNNRHF